MMQLARLILAWSARHVLLFVLIVAAMVAFVKAKQAYDRVPELRTEVAALEREQRLLDAEVSRQRQAARAALAAIQRAERPALLERLRQVRTERAALERAAPGRASVALGAAQGEGGAIASALAARFRIELLRREEAAIAARLRTLAHEGHVQGIRARILALDREIVEHERNIARIQREHPLLGRIEMVPLVRRLEGPWAELRTARKQLAAARAERDRLVLGFRSAETARAGAERGYAAARAAAEAVPAPAELGGRIAAAREELSGHWATRTWNSVRPVLGWALWVVLLVVAVPPAVKALWFFIVAPFAARLTPVRIGTPGAAIGWAEARTDGSGSGTSRRVRLAAGDELLVRPEYLQSSVAGAGTGSQLLLSRALPLGSFATGLIGLTRIRAARETEATLSATHDLVDEVGLIDVPEGAAILFRPTNLVGIILPAGRPLRLQRIWTTGRLLSWLTLRLRHLVFHGPCVLVAKGARGIALEPAGSGRRIAGDAILGWSGGLAQRVERSEAFLAYLTGKQPLFLNRFEGEGVVVYEEMPRARTRPGLFGRGLEGLGDGLLKVVGL